VDERKKTIRELEAKKGETLENLNKLRESWGETLLFRLDREDSDRFADELGRYRHFLETIALLRERIRRLEEDALRLGDLETTLAETEKTGAEKTGALKELYIGLGEIALRHDTAFDGEASLRAQAEDLTARIGAHQERLAELEEEKNAGIFSWIRGNARGALIRSGLAKNQAALNRLYGLAGEQCFAALERQGEAGEALPAGDIPERIGALRRELELLEESRSSLREERGTLRKSLGIEGNSRNFNPAKKIREAEQRIAAEEKQLAEFYAAFGNRLYELFADTKEEADTGGSGWLLGEDKNILARMREMLDEIAGHEAGIEKLKASLQIDEQRDAIDKMKKSILNHRQRIAASENAIAGLEKQIEKSNHHIEALMKL
jgi:hypothetical protein